MGETRTPLSPQADWPEDVFRILREGEVRVVGFVPDAGLKRLIELCQKDPSMAMVSLTTEEEGVGLSLGGWLGGQRSALLLQSSGVGNLVNVLGMAKECRLPILLIVTMRGQEGEFNPWQKPMGQATPEILKAMGVRVLPALEAAEVGETVRAGLAYAYHHDAVVAVLISQAVLGIKSFQEQREE